MEITHSAELAMPIEVLLIEDNPGDVRLTREAFKEGKVLNHLNVVGDGDEAIAFLQRLGTYSDAPRPDLILLDLNLPRRNGLALLSQLKRDKELKRIPVVILTTSDSERDIIMSYDHHANCYIRKPVDLDQFINVIRTIDDFWCSIVRLPKES